MISHESPGSDLFRVYGLIRVFLLGFDKAA